MPRVGQNPMKSLRRAFVPQPVSVCTIVYIPELTGYWAQSFEVLKVCLSSILSSTTVPFDLVVLDNGSCAEVREFLLDLNKKNVIQELLLSSSNMGKAGAWNVLFPACPGKMIAFTDSDVLFKTGWLKATLRVFEAFDGVGMVTARPSRTAPVLREELLGATLRYAERGHAEVTRGDLIPRAVIDEHLTSLGPNNDPGLTAVAYEDVLLRRKGTAAFAYAGHFQFVVPREVALRVLPLDVDRALGGVRELDRRINALGLLRLSLTEPLVRHLGNTLSEDELRQLNTAHPLTAEVLQGHVSEREVLPPSFVVRNLRTLARVRRVRKLMQRGYATLFKVLEK